MHAALKNESTGVDGLEKVEPKNNGLIGTSSPQFAVTDHPVSRSDSTDVETAESNNGLKRTEAITAVWSKTSLILAYIGVYVLIIVASTSQNTTGNLTPYVTSSFSAHSLLAVANMLSYIFAGITLIPFSRLLDIWGRMEGLAAVVFSTVLGLILMATCDSVSMYTAAMIFFETGYSGFIYVVGVFIADTASVDYRALILGLSKTPYICKTFAGPVIAQVFYEKTSFRWAFGMFAIVLPAFSLPIILVFYRNQRKAISLGRLGRAAREKRTPLQSILYYSVEYDVLGVFLACAGFTLFLLPFNLAASGERGWSSAQTISMMVIGSTLLVVCVVYERYLTPKPFFPYTLMRDRNAWGACALSFGENLTLFCWKSYFTSYLQVVNGQSIQSAGYIANIHTVGAAISAVLSGYTIGTTRRFKLLALLGVTLMTLGCGLMIHFRQPSSPLGYVIMCQIIISAASGMLMTTEYAAMLSNGRSVYHDYDHGSVASRVAILYLFIMIGGAIGTSVSGAIWTNSLRTYLIELLPPGSKDEADRIYASLPTQLSYPVGSPIRDATISAYAKVQQSMTITATATMVVCWVGVLLLRDVERKGAGKKDG